jgi:MoaA/NifB/PqqE/SkfB family radical SAM enzyme
MENGLYTVFVPNRSCNLNCTYCNTGLSDFLKNNNNYHADDVNKLLSKSRDIVDTKILKIVGGGEIFLIEEFENWVIKQAPYYTSVFILTNGVSVCEKRIDFLAKISNIHFGLSLDGHNLKMNHYRFKNKTTFDKVMSTFNKLGQSSVPMQINMVMHDLNCDQFIDYIKFLQDTNYPLNLHTSPLMYKNSNQTKIQNNAWIKQLETLLNDYESFSNMLLPKKYYELLHTYYTDKGIRNLRCYIPFFMVQLFSTGNLTSCPIVWNANLGNILKIDPNTFNLYEQKIYTLLNQPKPRLPFCKSCISSYDIFNLFMDSQIAIDEIQKIRLFSPPDIANRIKEIKENLLSNSGMSYE